MGEEKKCCFCISYQSRAIFYAWTNVFVTGFQLMMPIISSLFVTYLKVKGHSFDAKYMLKEETLSIFRRIPMTPKLRNEFSPHAVLDDSSLPNDVHMWSTWLFVKVVMFTYSIVLIAGARKKEYNYCLAWFALNVPITAHYLMTMSMDLGMGLMAYKPLKYQIFQYVNSAYQILGLLFIYMFLRQIHFLRGVRYRDFQHETDGKFRDTAHSHTHRSHL